MLLKLLSKSGFFKRMLIKVAEEKAKQPCDEIWTWKFTVVKHGSFDVLKNDIFNSDEKPEDHDAGRDCFGNVYLWINNSWKPFTNDIAYYMDLLPFAEKATKITLQKYFKSEYELLNDKINK